MRIFSLLFLVAFLGIVGAFIWQNDQDVSLTFFNYSWTTNMPILIGATFVLGMLSGWSVVGMLRRSVDDTVQLFNRPRPVTRV